MRLTRALHAAALCATLLWPVRLAYAEPDVAKDLFDRGLAHFEAGRYDAACPAFAESLRRDPRPGTLFTLAECEAKRGKLAAALRRYDEYLALYATLPPDKKQKQGTRAKDSREARDALADQVPELAVTLPPGSPPGTVVTMDEVPLATPAAGFRVDPGEHILTTRAPGGPVTETRVVVGKGEKKSVQLEVKAAPPATAPGPVTPPPALPPGTAGPSARRLGAFVAGGIGAAGVLIGAITGGLALAKKGTVDANCGASDGHPEDPSWCNHTGLTAANSLKALGAASTAAFAIGGAGVVTGVILFTTEPKAKAATLAWKGAF
jgi:hypothetical protein